MTFLLKQSLQGMFYAPALPPFWIAVALLVAAAVVKHRTGSVNETTGKPNERALVFLFPPCIVVWAHFLFGSLQGKSSGWYWQDLGVWLLLLAQVVVAVCVLWRHRARLDFTLVLFVVAAAWGSSAGIVAEMAIHNDWL